MKYLLEDVWKVLVDVSNGWLKDIFNMVLVEGKITKDWTKSFIVPIFIDVRECGNNKSTKLMSHIV